MVGQAQLWLDHFTAARGRQARGRRLSETFERESGARGYQDIGRGIFCLFLACCVDYTNTHTHVYT